jgi:hypothetical protein
MSNTTPTPVQRTTRGGRPFPLLPQEVLVKDPITGHMLCAEYRHEKLRTKGKGDRYKVYHPLFGTQGFRWVRHANFNHIGVSASGEDHDKHAQQRETEE